MSWNFIEMQTRAAGRRRSLTALACCMAAGLTASGCGGDGDSEAACEVPNDELRAFIEVRDDNGACTQCSAEGGLTIVTGVANGCNEVARFTTPDGCLVHEFSLVKDSGETVLAPLGCLPAVTDWELQPGEVVSSDLEWGGGADELSNAWGPVEPGHYRFALTVDMDLMTESEIAPPVELEIIVTEP